MEYLNSFRFTEDNPSLPIGGGSAHLDVLSDLLGCLPVLVLSLEVDLALN